MSTTETAPNDTNNTDTVMSNTETNTDTTEQPQQPPPETTEQNNKRTHNEMNEGNATMDVEQPDEKRPKTEESATVSNPPPQTTIPPPTKTQPTGISLLQKLKMKAAKIDAIMETEPSAQTTTSTGDNTPKVANKRGRKPKAKSPPAATLASEDDVNNKRNKRATSSRLEVPPSITDYNFQQCYKLLSVLMTHRWSWPFKEPVDPVKLDIPDYFSIIKNPMDLGTVDKKLQNNEYTEIQEFADDVNLVWNNCVTYNQPESHVVQMANELKKLFVDKWSKLLQDIQSGILSPENDLKRNTEMTEKAKPVRAAKAAAKGKTAATPTATPAPVVEAKEMSFEEKKELRNSISKLEMDKLEKVVEIIQQQAPKASTKANDTTIEIDLDKLGASTLRALEKYVSGALKKKKKPTKKKSTPSNRSSTNVVNNTNDASNGQSVGDANSAQTVEGGNQTATPKKKKKSEQDSESSGGDSDDSSNTESSSDSDTSDSDSESEKEKFMNNMNLKDESQPQSLSNQPAPADTVDSTTPAAPLSS